MSDTTENPEGGVPPVTPTPKTRERAAPVEKDKGHYATLVRGINYAVRHGEVVYRFKGGVRSARPIPSAVKAHLEQHAIDHVTVTDGDESAITEPRDKFRFEAA